MERYGQWQRSSAPQARKSSIWDRIFRQLGVAVVLFGLWMAFRLSMPQAAGYWEGQLSGLLTASCDFKEACSQLGEDLSRGEDLVVSVGNWCEAVFLPDAESDAPEN